MGFIFNGKLGYLIGKAKHVVYDKEVVKRIEDIQALDASIRATLFNVIDAYLRDYKEYAQNTQSERITRTACSYSI